jgi:hypothetical protein
MGRVAAFLVVLAVLAVGLSFIIGNGFVGFVTAVVIAVGGPLAFARFEGRKRRGRPPHWKGYVSFYEVSLQDRFPGISSRRRTGGFGGNGLSSGKCRVDREGIHWTSGGWATPSTTIAGNFDLPWSRIESGRAFALARKVPGLGGGIELVLADCEGTISGEFLGSVSGLSVAIEAGVRAQSQSS